MLSVIAEVIPDLVNWYSTDNLTLIFASQHGYHAPLHRRYIRHVQCREKISNHFTKENLFYFVIDGAIMIGTLQLKTLHN